MQSPAPSIWLDLFRSHPEVLALCHLTAGSHAPIHQSRFHTLGHQPMQLVVPIPQFVLDDSASAPQLLILLLLYRVLLAFFPIPHPCNASESHSLLADFLLLL